MSNSAKVIYVFDADQMDSVFYDFIRSIRALFVSVPLSFSSKLFEVYYIKKCVGDGANAIKLPADFLEFAQEVAGTIHFHFILNRMSSDREILRVISEESDALEVSVFTKDKRLISVLPEHVIVPDKYPKA